MQVIVTGHQMEVGEALQTYAQEKIEELKQFYDQVIDAQVTCSFERHEHLVEITLHASGIHLRAEGEGEDWYPAVDDAADKLRRQLKKYKGRLQKHRTRRENETNVAAPAFEASLKQVAEESLENAPEDLLAEFEPEVTHQEISSIPALTVDEAVMQMDLLHQNVFLFQNVYTGKLSAVYRAKVSGPVTWLEVNDASKLSSAA